ncbi:MAG: hypothetical protein K6F22_05190 [Prevotella sp.]|nr:hypothetical protein [Prevotella sp.]
MERGYASLAYPRLYNKVNTMDYAVMTLHLIALLWPPSPSWREHEATSEENPSVHAIGQVLKFL